jgi:ElaA protein
MNLQDVRWSLVPFDHIAPADLYDALALRERVFIVEQQCVFLDTDGVDCHSWHLLGRTADGALTAYLRIVPPGRRFAEPSIGRVVTAPEVRRNGLGRVLMNEGIRRTAELFPGQPIKISAQRYLKDFYGSLGFVTDSEPYDEDGIPHINMVLARGEPGVSGQ